LIAEIQQTSDVTYRIYDYDRRDDNGNPRELHTELALDVIDYTVLPEYKTPYQEEMNETVQVVSCPYFTTNVLKFNKTIEKDINELDSFVIYICLEGNFEIVYDGGKEVAGKGETLLIPASLESYKLSPVSGEVKLMEVYIK
jgi:mannose-6-phosphate isomerase